VTDNKWLNLFEVTYEGNNGEQGKWTMVSRKKDPFGDSSTDAVAIITYLGDKLVMIEQYRLPINDYNIENPAGIMEPGKTVLEIARQEVWEEVGLKVETAHVISAPLFNSPGMTNESIVYVVAQTYGLPHTNNNENTEDIKIHILDQAKAKELLASGKKFSAKCWFVLMGFVNGIDWRTV